MTQSSPERKPCGTCGEEYTVTAAGGMRSHFTDNPDFQADPADPDNRKCKGVGRPPVTPAGVALAEDMTADGPQCRLCRHPVQLYGNGRVRSHLTPEQTPRPCPAGSDFPLGVYPDIAGTTDGLVATLAFDCEHREIGACYDCAGVAVSAELVGDGDGTEPRSEPVETITRTGTNTAAVAAAPTMADQLKAAGDEQPLEGWKGGWKHEDGTECPVFMAKPSPAKLWCTEHQQHVAWPYGSRMQEFADAERMVDGAPSDDDRPQASRFTELMQREVGNPGTVLDRIDPAVFKDHRTPEQKAHDAETSRLTREAIAVLEQRSPEEKAETAARMDRTASAALGLPLDPALNHQYTDPSGIVWDHNGPAETCPAPDCTVLRQGLPEGFDPKCGECNTDNHRCPGCGEAVPHGTTACTDCDRRVMANRLPKGETEDGRPCYHDDAVFGVEGDQLVCVACGTPCTHPDGFTENDPEDDGEGLIFTCALCGTVDPGDERPDADDGWRTPAEGLALMSEEIRGLDALRLNCRTCGHPVTPLVEAFDLYGKAKAVLWVCEPAQHAGSLSCDNGGHECKPDVLVRLGELEVGEHFVRRGAVMRVTNTLSGDVHAVVVEGPMKGREGVLPDNHETVERTYCRHEYDYNGRFCDYCGVHDREAKEQETTECTDDRTATRRPGSSAVAAPATTAPAPGSRRPTAANAPAASPSTKATSSAPTAKAGTNGRSAAGMTDQSAAAAAFLGGSRPAVPAQPGPTDQSAAAAQFLAGGSGAHGEKETKRDRFGRYLIPHPDTGEEQAWTRATTFAKSISDTYALSQWGLRMALLGATVRPDIVQRAHGKHVKADKQLLDELTADLKNAAGDKVAANLGTSMHSFKELADKAWHSPGGPRSVMDQVPPDCREDIETYIRMLDELGLEPVPHLVEFTTVVKQYGIAGTSDNCYKVTKPLVLKIGRAEVRLEPGEYVVGDLKTGKDLDYGWQEIAIQIGLYAQGINTAGVWDRHEEKWHPDPLNGAKVRTDAGIVVHLPVDKSGKKQPAVYGIDLESGWNAAVLCERVREWRKVRNLASPVMVSEAAETFAPSRPAPAVVTRTTVRPPTLKDRAEQVTSKGEASAVWKEATKQGLPESDVDELVALMQARLAKLAEPGG
ncbi:hypothetical protein [Streptomyces sp. S1D4-14]|uniref:hypothetical protein n=1 Tax=Streptomyces sp. S1D4-14 TaxID=2594461 RepID=UPI0011651203|nr:hypothetical protein [Streptomyces sp. S1D4-14]QDN64391.1 hypothetical protein FNV66_00740 [Streptomyces sp. S1D4-14]